MAVKHNVIIVPLYNTCLLSTNESSYLFHLGQLIVVFYLPVLFLSELAELLF